MKGDKMASRVAASILGAVGLGNQLVVNTYNGECSGVLSPDIVSLEHAKLRGIKSNHHLVAYI